MADALLYATARTQDAQFITSEAHFRNLPHVKMI
jgi:predicted nucleic acid-binding protein